MWQGGVAGGRWQGGVAGGRVVWRGGVAGGRVVWFDIYVKVHYSINIASLPNHRNAHPGLILHTELDTAAPTEHTTKVWPVCVCARPMCGCVWVCVRPMCV